MSSATDVIKILVSTDNHLGYLERDPIRGNDSFESFEEVFKIAQEKQVDFVLLGGDVFHDNKPSRKCLHRTMEILQKYVMGEREIEFEVVSDQKLNFAGAGRRQHVNYEDPNCNVQLPVFVIHGNHDDPVGESGLGCIDILSSANLVNYFGRSEKVDDIELYPVCIQKGDTKLGLYGLGHIRDQRLYRTFESGHVKFFKPEKDTEKWFNIFVVHQNRHHHAHKNYLDENFLDPQLDICIWGHEHECTISGGMNGLPETAKDGIIIIQPGSTIATSLVAAEGKEKHVALLEIKDQLWKMTPIPLKTVRPMMVFESKLTEMHNQINSSSPQEVAKFIETWVDRLVEECKEIVAKRGLDITDPKVATLLRPLIRINIECGKFTSPFHPQQFGQRFVGKIANPSDMIYFRKGRITEEARNDDRSNNAQITNEDGMVDGQGIELNASDITSYVVEILAKSTKAKLQVLSVSEMTEAVTEFAIKEEKHAISEFVEKRLKEIQQRLIKEGAVVNEYDPASDIAQKISGQYKDDDEQLLSLKQTINEALQRGDNELLAEETNNGNDDENEVVSVKPSSRKARINTDFDDEEFEEDDNDVLSTKTNKSKASKRSRAVSDMDSEEEFDAPKVVRRRVAGATTTTNDDEVVVVAKPTRGRGSRGGSTRGGRGGRTSKATTATTTATATSTVQSKKTSAGPNTIVLNVSDDENDKLQDADSTQNSLNGFISSNQSASRANKAIPTSKLVSESNISSLVQKSPTSSYSQNPSTNTSVLPSFLSSQASSTKSSSTTGRRWGAKK